MGAASGSAAAAFLRWPSFSKFCVDITDILEVCRSSSTAESACEDLCWLTVHSARGQERTVPRLITMLPTCAVKSVDQSAARGPTAFDISVYGVHRLLCTLTY
jgi:hypothetical protein